MNILILNWKPIVSNHGGIQRVSDIISRQLKARGHCVCFVSYTKGHVPLNYTFPCPQFYIDKSQNFKEEWLRILDREKISVIINQVNDEFSRDLLYNTPKDIKVITVCHIQPYAGIDFIKKSVQAMVPRTFKDYVLKIAGNLIPGLLKYFIIIKERKNIKDIVNLSDKYCVFAEGYIRRIFQYDHSFDIDKAIVIPNPHCMPPYVNENKEKIILFVGRLHNNPKNVVDFLKVWSKIYKMNKDWKAIVIGEGPDKDYLKQYCTTKNINNIIFLGQQNDVLTYYKKAKFICVTSIHESWNLSLVEGMSQGCVPIAFNTYEAVSEIIDDRQNGILIPPFNTDEMSNVINELINNESQWEQMSKNAIAKSNNYTEKNIGEKWDDMLRNV